MSKLPPPHVDANSNSVSKATRPRRVFGRREAEVGGKTMRFEMRVDGVYVRRKHGRKQRVLSWDDLVCAAGGQYLLKL